MATDLAARLSPVTWLSRPSSGPGWAGREQAPWKSPPIRRGESRRLAPAESSSGGQIPCWRPDGRRQRGDGGDVEPDGVLIERSVHGRPDAFAEVARRHEAAIHGYLTRRTGRQAADDLLAEVWLRAFAARGGYDAGHGDARPWLYGIARNVLREHWRTGSGLELAAVDQMRSDPWDGIDDRLDFAERVKATIAAVRALPAAEREVLLLVAWEQLTPAEAAEALGVPQGTARSRLHRARVTLRRVLSELDPDEAEVSR
jgi:RNA polymerase sigma factor (sigma-70 family)